MYFSLPTAGVQITEPAPGAATMLTERKDEVERAVGVDAA